MGSGGSKVDKVRGEQQPSTLHDLCNTTSLISQPTALCAQVLEEKMRRKELMIAGDEEEDEDGKDLRRSNSLVLALEDYLDGKAEDVEPRPEEELVSRLFS